jgi:uncharacterized protein YuzE
VSVRIAGHEFVHATYDESADVLYLRNDAGTGGVPVTTYGTPEGHAVRVDAEGRVVGLTIVNARWLVERDGEIDLTIPQRQIAATAEDVSSALARSVKA